MRSEPALSDDAQRTFEQRLGRRVAVWVRLSARRRIGVLWLALAVFCAAAFTTFDRLGIRSETEALFPETLPFRVRDARFLARFPMLAENISIVIDGPGAEPTRDATLELARRLEADHALFPYVHLAQSPFLEENALLFLSLDELDSLVDRFARLQPILGVLARDPSLTGFADQLRRALEASRHDPDDRAAIDLERFLARFDHALRASLEVPRPADEPAGVAPAPDALRDPVSIDWSDFVAADSDYEARDTDAAEHVATRDLRRIIQVQPTLDYAALAAAEEPIERIRAHARELGITPERGFRLGLTGDMVLNLDEMRLLRSQVGGAGLLSLCVVAILLQAGLRSTRLVVATVVSLLFGLVVTAGFASLAIGHLNMISVAFAVLFIGLAVDFGIHLCMRFQELRVEGAGPEAALVEAAHSVGSSLLLCAVTTAVGFFAFVPTEFVGVAELGVIAGVGMFIGAFASLTILPALLIGDARDAPSVAQRPRLTMPNWPSDYAPWVGSFAALLFVFSATQLPRLRFDPNPLNVRDPAAPSVRVYRDLLADSAQSPWSLEYLAESAAQAEAIARRFEALPEVDSTRRLADFVPDDQDQKLAAIEELAYYVDWQAIDRRTTSAHRPAARIAESIRALERLQAELERVARARPTRPGEPAARNAIGTIAGHAAEALASLLERLAETSPALRARTLDSLERRLLGNFEDVRAGIDRVLRARSFTAPDLPASLRAARVSRSGEHRVEILAAEDLTRPGALARFVDAATRITPELAGPAMRIHASAQAVSGALERAIAAAVVVILLLLSLLWRRASDVVLVMLPLGWAGCMTGASMVVAGIPFNFADVIVLPLLLGIGVDSGIHLVHRARIRTDPSEPLLATSTARAVVFSAFTTIASFGTLALVPHQGMASLGRLLVIGVGWTVVANLVLLPALLALRERRT